MKNTIILALCLAGLSVSFAQESDSSGEPPAKIEIGILSNIFHPVHFEHKLHADMTTMGVGCATCHHHAPDSVYQACGECHLSEESEASLAMPTLNGAYHRNCLNCHQDWTGDDVCETCHVKRKFSFSPRRSLDATDVLVHKHKEIIVPTLFHFVSPESKQKPVVFHHEEHVDLYRYDCEHCHRQASCVTCHDYSPQPTEHIYTLDIHHNPCSNCHDTEDENTCTRCHTDSPSQGFNHDNTGWSLNKHHTTIACENCHTGSEPIAKVDPNCTTCHVNFELDEFDHSKTGLQLNDDHIEIDCYECHIDNRYDVAPSCVECHDEDLSFPTEIPGDLIKLK
jgi:hypothetical protein